MRKTVRNCRSLNMQTIRVRRDRPGSVALAMALAITMLIVYLLSLQSMPDDENPQAQAAAALRTSSEIRMEPMEVYFLLSSVHDDETQARIAAALCTHNGGAGLILPEEDRFCVIYEAGKSFPDGGEPALKRISPGLTLKIQAPAAQTAALSDGLCALRALADDTASLAASLEKGETDMRTVASLLDIHQTRIKNAAETLLDAGPEPLLRVRSALQDSLGFMYSAAENPDPAALRMLHAAACMEWIYLSNTLQTCADSP